MLMLSTLLYSLVPTVAQRQRTKLRERTKSHIAMSNVRAFCLVPIVCGMQIVLYERRELCILVYMNSNTQKSKPQPDSVSATS